MSKVEKQSSPEEKEYKKKVRKRRIKRGILIFLNAVLATYFVYCIYDTCVEFFRKNFENNDKIISIGGFSETKSLEIYDKVIDKDENGHYKTYDITDFSYYAGYLNFKEDSSTLNEDGSLKFSSFETYTLRYVTEGKYEKIDPYHQVNTYINNSIFLFDEDLKEGDYIVYPYEYIYDGKNKPEQIPLKIASQKGICETYYSPLINGTRRQIQIKSKASSPALVITLKNIYVPGNEFNDVAILYENDADKNKISEIFDNNKFLTKYIAKKDQPKNDLIALYEAKSIVSIIVEKGSDIVLSHYINVSDLHNSNYKNDTLSLESSLSNYDNDKFIRELGGNIFNAGSALPCSDNSTKWLSGYKEDYDAGSLVLHVGIDSIGEVKPLLEKLVNFNFL